MTEIGDRPKNKFFNTLKWYMVGCLITLLVFQIMRFFKMDIYNVAVCFQTGCGIFLGAMLQMRAWSPRTK